MVLPYDSTPDQNPSKSENTRIPQAETSILLVEDDPGVRRVLRLYLREFDWTIEEAEDGDAAAALLNDGRTFDLVITDLAMPGSIQGEELIRRAKDKDPNIAAIVMTGNSSGSESKEYQLLLKPVRRADFLSAVSTAIATR